MRHFHLRRLPPFSHDPTSSALHGVQPLSTATAEMSGGCAITSDALVSSCLSQNSHDCTSRSSLPVNPMLLSRPSRRQMRQREQRWGALWRYRPDTFPLPVNRSTPLPVPSLPSPLVRVGDLSAAPSQDVRAAASLGVQAELVSLGRPTPVSAVPENSTKGSRLAGTASRNASDFLKEEAQTQSPRAAAAAATSSADPSFAAQSTPRNEDPLLAFLETHEDDAADLLVMWTSLHRSCVYASELSESVVLQVRYFFHSLLRNRAIAAAVEFYHRLMGLGVQLQQSDLLLLFSSLPYEHAAATEEEQLQKAKESAAMEKDRVLWAKRRREFQEAAQRSRATAVEPKAKTTLPAKEEAKESNVVEQRVTEGAQPSSSPLCGRAGEEQEAHPPSSIAQRVGFQQQPEWIKRWILYEASMGTLDGLDGPDVASAPPQRMREMGLSLGEHDSGGDAAWSLDASASTAVESAALSERASRVMELTAIVDHLRLLTLGAMQREQQSMRRRGRSSTTQRTPRSPARLTSVRAAEKLYWREALRVVRNAFAAPLWWSPPAVEPLVLPPDLASTLLEMMREAPTWEGALTALRLTTPHALGKSRRPSRELGVGAEVFGHGAILFTALAASAQPWKTQATVEDWMHQCMLPRLASTPRAPAAAVTAVFALWLSHLCGVKAARPEEFIVMADEVAVYLPISNTSGITALQLLHSDLSCLIADVQARAEEAVDALVHEVHESTLTRRAALALAKSIQSGAYRLDQPEDDAEQAKAIEEDSAWPPLTPVSLPSSALLSCSQVDSFVLCCAAVRETVWLRVSTAALMDRASVTAEVLQFLDGSLYGTNGLHTLYNSLYGHANAAAAATAPERPFVAAVLAVTLLEVVPLLCASSAQRRRFGSQVSHRDTLVLLVELARHVLDSVQPAHVKAAPWRWAVEAQISKLIRVTARTLQAVVGELDIHARNEKIVFGALPERDLRLLAELARLLLKTSDLATTQATRNESELLCPVWRVLTSTVSPHVLHGVQLCFRSDSTLGRRVRHQLTSHEAQRLDFLLRRPRSIRKDHVRSTRGDTRPQRMRTLDVGLQPRVPVTDSDFALAMATRDSVYAAVKREATADGVGNALQHLAAAASTSWKASLQLCQVATKEVALARGTCNVDFFATVLKSATSDLAERKAMAASSASSDVSHRNRRSGRAAVTVGPPTLWLSAIDVFWSAVDHTTGTSAAPSEQLLCDAPIPTPTNAAQTNAQKQERAVLAQLLLPLIEFSRVVSRADVGRQWRRTWATKYSASEKQSPQFLRQNILALSALGDASALEKCVSSYAQLGRDEAVLCHVAVQHKNWEKGLDALFKVCGTIEDVERSQSCYPVSVARTILTLLARSPTNLSNTAMRLETLQGREWDAECSVQVVRLLLRARRWALALRHVETALHTQPMLQRLHSRMTSSTAESKTKAGDGSSRIPTSSQSMSIMPVSPQEAVPYVTLLTLALQATAVGGDSASAPFYYDALKFTMAAVFESADERTAATPADATRVPSHEARAARSGLDTVFDMTSASALSTDSGKDGERSGEYRYRAELRELAVRARLLFFRAMTKKMMSTKRVTGRPVSAEDEEDEVVARSNDYWADTKGEAGDNVHTP